MLLTICTYLDTRIVLKEVQQRTIQQVPTTFRAQGGPLTPACHEHAPPRL